MTESRKSFLFLFSSALTLPSLCALSARAQLSMRCEYFQARFSSSEWGGEVAIPDDTPGGAAAAEL